MIDIYLLTNDGFSIVETRTKPIGAKLRFQGQNVRVWCLNASSRRVGAHRWNYAAMLALQAPGIKYARLRDTQKRYSPTRENKSMSTAKKLTKKLL